MAISYNEPITFGRNGSAKQLNCSGIDFTEDGVQSWTCAHVAELDIQLPFARQDIVLRIEASPFLVPEQIAGQDVFIFMGGMFAGFCKLSGHGTKTFPLSRSTVSGRLARLALVIPTAASPRSLQLSQDERELGIYLTTITFSTT